MREAASGLMSVTGNVGLLPKCSGGIMSQRETAVTSFLKCPWQRWENGWQGQGVGAGHQETTWTRARPGAGRWHGERGPGQWDSRALGSQVLRAGWLQSLETREGERHR